MKDSSSGIHREMALRKTRALKIPEQMVELLGAYCPAISEEHRVVVEFPFRRRMQPALALIDGPDMASEVEGFGAIFPNDAPHGIPFDDSVLAARIGVVHSHLRKELTQHSSGVLLKQLCDSSFLVPPYSARPVGEVSKLIGHVLSECIRRGVDQSKFEEALIESIESPSSGTPAWSPVCLRLSPYALEDNESWRILDAWADWERRGLNAGERADEFYGRGGGKLEHNKFRTRLHYLKLPVRKLA